MSNRDAMATMCSLTVCNNSCLARVALKNHGRSWIWVIVGDELGRAKFLFNLIECLLMVGLRTKVDIPLGLLS